MTNYEHYREQIEKLARMGQKVAVIKDTNVITHCIGTGCGKCLFGEGNCAESALQWADAEYIESGVDWSKVPVDTPVLVKVYSNGNWVRRYFAKYKNGCVYTFGNGTTSWSSNNEGTTSWNYAKLAEGEQEWED